MAREWHWRCMFSEYKETLYREMDYDLEAMYNDNVPKGGRTKKRTKQDLNNWLRNHNKNSYVSVIRRGYTGGAISSLKEGEVIGDKEVPKPSRLATILREA